ncbi:EF-hand domain-containing protein [Streptomyces sp. CB00455]|uniref:EF-hand domain-containing protein n=1 Tax=Streptomyces sp. CB00455 TaxID=1703927 RepID=UPI001A9080DB|nr:EF-hand domain-containing protein [Streptomyces sp. CB00455]
MSTATKHVRAGDSFDRTYRPHMEAVVDLADADGDGVLSRSEFIRLGAPAVSEEQSHRSFDQVDTDGDGSLTAQELVAAARDFYVSDDPEAVGNHLFGQL